MKSLLFGVEPSQIKNLRVVLNFTEHPTHNAETRESVSQKRTSRIMLGSGHLPV